MLASAVNVYAQQVSGQSNTIHINYKQNAQQSNPVKSSQMAIVWVSPVNQVSNTNTRSVKLKAGIRSDVAVKSVDIYVNDKPVGDDRGFSIVEATESESFAHIVEKQLNLNEGENVIKIVATNQSGSSVSDQRVVKVSVPKVVRTDYALLFATDDFDNWNDLVNPINDATTIAEELQKNYGFKVELIKNPTTDEVMIKLREYADKSYQKEDQLFIFFAGHGQFDETFKEGYVVCKNSILNDRTKLSYLSHSNLRTVINNIPCDHILLAMDVCFGGTFDPVIASAGYRGQEEVNELTHSEYISRKLKFKTRKYLTSGGKEYVPDGRPGQHSPFARKFLEALRNYGGGDKILTLPELLIYLEKLKPEPRFGEFGSNEPGSDFVFQAK